MRTNSAIAPLALVLFGLAGTCTLGVIGLERASHRPAGARTDFAPVVALIDLERSRSARGRPLESHALWTQVAHGARVRSEVVEVAQLEDLAHRRHDVWVIAGQEPLDARDWDALHAYLADGGAALLVGSVGARPLTRLFPKLSFEPAPAAPSHLSITRRGPLVAGFEPGQRLELREDVEVLRAVGGCSGSWEGKLDSGALLDGSYAQAPVVWLGADLHQFADPDAAARLADNALRFALREPIADLGPWPDGRGTAALLAVRAAPLDRRAERAVRAVGKRGVTPLLVVDPSIALDRRDAAQRLAPVSETVLSAGLPGPGGLRRARDRITAALDAEVRGYAGAESDTRLSGAGFDFVALADRHGDVPRLLGDAASGIVALPTAEGAASAPHGGALKQLLRAYERSEELGGLFHVAFESEWGAGDHLRQLERLIGELHARGAWFAGGHELAHWWRTRARVAVELDYPRFGQALVRVRNDGEANAHGLTVRVYAPVGARRPGLEEPHWSLPEPRLRLASDRSWVELVIPEVDAGESVEYTLHF